MKKINNNKAITFIAFVVIIVVAILASGISVYAAYTYYANNIGYTKTDGTETSVGSALNELYEIMNTPPTIKAESVKYGYGDNGNTATVTNLDADCYYVCVAQFRNDTSSLSVSNAEVIYDNYAGTYLDYKYATHMAYIHTLDSTVTFTVSGARGIMVACYKIE